MDAQPHTQDLQNQSDTAQHAINQSQTSAAETSNRLPRSQRRRMMMEKKDLATPDPAEDEIAPPTYGQIYGEIEGETNGLGTSANVTDDGRVNIRVNQLNRRLSQTFVPALRQQAKNIQDSQSEEPSIPADLGAKDGVLPPALSIVIHVVGSRGDVQPFVALGKVLKTTYGHRVRIATHPTFREFVLENDLEFFSIGGDPAKLMAFMVKNPSLMPTARSIMSGDVSQRKKDVAEYIQGCWRSCYEAGDGMSPQRTFDDTDSESKAPKTFVADCIIANPPSFAHIHCAEKLGFPHPLANIQSSSADPQLTNYLSYAMIEVLSWQGLGEIINRFRAKCLGLDPISLIWAPGTLQRLKIPHTYFWSPALIPKPKDWGSHIQVSGFSFLDLAPNYTPCPDLCAFLDSGPTPIYIGFGSIVLEDPMAMTELIFAAVAKTGRRCLLSQGWGGIGADTRIPDNVFILGNVPHDWLFKHVSCVVHHGGAGTTAAGISSGRPTLVVPFFGDQPFWGSMVAQAGAGPPPIPHKKLTAENLAIGIEFCLRPESMARAQELGAKIALESGKETASHMLHRSLNVDRLRCNLAPSFCAVWRVRKTKIRLSAFAACTLVNAGLVRFGDLKLFRAQEYQTDEGPWDPVSGFGTAVFGAFSNMAMGVADIPAESWRGFQMPFKSSQKQSTSVVAESLTPIHGTQDIQDSVIARTQSGLTTEDSSSFVDKESDRSPSSHSNMDSISISSTSNSQRSSRNVSKSRQQKDPGFAKPSDMMVRNVHTSKGIGRIVRTGFRSPVDLSMGITKGFHNMPRMWGDDTVRPQEKVTDLKTGFTAAGREFGFGWYDGLTGVVTQPYRGAQKEGAAGFVKGVGKGIAGLVTKPGAALFGLPSHFMEGVHKQIQKLYTGNVQDYIIASRTAQGYEDWLRRTDVEKQDVVERWALIQKYVKGKHTTDEMMEDILDRQQSHRIGARDSSLSRQESVSTLNDDSRHASVVLPQEVPASSLPQARHIPEMERNDGSRTQATSRSDLGESDAHRRASWYNPNDKEASMTDEGDWNDEDLRQAMAASLIDSHRNSTNTLQSAHHLRQPVSQISTDGVALGKQSAAKRRGIDQDPECVQAVRESELMAAQLLPSSSSQPNPVSDLLHLAGTTQKEFEARQQHAQGDKSAQERMEEDIVLEYIKKQSLLETYHRNQRRDGEPPSSR